MEKKEQTKYVQTSPLSHAIIVVFGLTVIMFVLQCTCYSRNRAEFAMDNVFFFSFVGICLPRGSGNCTQYINTFWARVRDDVFVYRLKSVVLMESSFESISVILDSKLVQAHPYRTQRNRVRRPREWVAKVKSKIFNTFPVDTNKVETAA